MLPEQGPSLQGTVSSASPVQLAPPFLASGFFDLLFTFIPSPQLELHEYSSHSLQTQSMAQRNHFSKQTGKTRRYQYKPEDSDHSMRM